MMNVSKTITILSGIVFLSACGQGSSSSAPEELFIGHSFFKPFANNMEPLQQAAGLEARTFEVVFSGGSNGAPQALWENDQKRREIQRYLDGGNVDLFAMTYESTYPTDEGYINWIEYARENNPDTTFVLALPWPDYPQDYTTAEEYSTAWHDGHDGDWSELVGSLRAAYPDNAFISLPYGQSALELRALLEKNQLPDIDAMVSPAEDDGAGIFVDEKGHADEILVDLGTLVWGTFLYDIDPDASLLQDSYEIDIAQIATDIVDEYME